MIKNLSVRVWAIRLLASAAVVCFNMWNTFIDMFLQITINQGESSFRLAQANFKKTSGNS